MNNLIILTAPPAAGKTFLIKSLIEELNQIPLVLAPLRALVDECRGRWQEKALVMTPEEWLLKPISTRTVIVDEFHLNLYWGDTFRPAMWEAFYGAVEDAELVLLLTATLNQEALDFIQGISDLFHCIWIDFGNQKLKYTPWNYLKAPSRNWIYHYLLSLPENTSGNLVFCRYRNEVLKLASELENKGYSVWACLGGEAQEFSNKVKTLPAPQIIVSTSVLSHGVNLPSIINIYFTYPVNNLDFWIQMVARGGRRGEKYKVISLEAPYGLPWSRWTNFLAIQLLGVKMGFKSGLGSLREWFLKA